MVSPQNKKAVDFALFCNFVSENEKYSLAANQDTKVTPLQ